MAGKKKGKKIVAKKPVKKVVAKKPAKKVAAKKPVKKVAAKKPAKKVAAKKPVKKVAAKKPVKKVAAKKPVKKVAARKPVKKVAAKKPVKKVAAKKPVKKVAVKKPAKKPVPASKPSGAVRPPAPPAAPKPVAPRPVVRPAAPPVPADDGRPVVPPAVPPSSLAASAVPRGPAERRVLVLGAGLVSRPLVQYLLRQPGYRVIVASRTVSKAQVLIGGLPNGEALAYDISRDPGGLAGLVSRCDLAVSLLPYVHHPAVARVCIDRRRHMVTTSYVSDAMRGLDTEARAAGVTLLNEIGVDPGIDHMSAMRVIHKVQREGGRVASFHSYCGGLPAPDANDNPLGYKFSWSPRGVVLAGRNAARYRKDGQVIEVPGPKLFDHYWEMKIDELGTMEAYPNRDSLGYLTLYGIESAKTMFRGTLRNVGWCRLWKKIADLGLLDDVERLDWSGKTLAQYLRGQLGPDASSDLREALARRLDLPPESEVLLRLEWLGLLSSDPVPIAQGSRLDVLEKVLLARMQYRPGERDMLVLRHEFLAEYPQGRREEITSTLIDYGVPHGDSSMARTVSLPAAIAVKLILEGRIQRRGVCIPVEPAIYHPVLDELETLGIRCVDRVVVR